MLRKCWLQGLIVVAAAMCSTRGANGDTATLIADRDNTLYQDAAGALSNGEGPTFFVGKNASGLARRGLLYFDIANTIPVGSTIESATLTLHLSQAPSVTSRAVGLHRALADWGEGDSTAGSGGGGNGDAAATGDATWVHTFYNTQTWTNVGGDFAATASAATNVTGVGDYSWSSSNLVADLQSWLDTPAGNFGWLLLGDESANQTVKRFDTRENVEDTFRPTLTIEYTPVPEPSSVVLMAIAGTVILSLRQRSRR